MNYLKRGRFDNIQYWRAAGEVPFDWYRRRDGDAWLYDPNGEPAPLGLVSCVHIPREKMAWMGFRYGDNIHPSVYDGKERLKVLDTDGVDADGLFLVIDGERQVALHKLPVAVLGLRNRVQAGRNADAAQRRLHSVDDRG